MNQALENLEGRNLQLEAEVASLKAERHQIRAALNHAEEIAEMWKKDIQKWMKQCNVAESRLRHKVSCNTEMQRKHKAEMRTEKNLAYANGWAAGFEAAEVMNTRCEVETSLKAQHLRLRREDPMVYMVKLFRSGAYMTQHPSHGLRQFFARDLKHPNLRLFSSREDARSVCKSLVAGNTWTDTYEVVEMPKHGIYSLPCYIHYHTHEAFQPLEYSNED